MAVSLWTINGEEDNEIAMHPSGQSLQMFWGPPLYFTFTRAWNAPNCWRRAMLRRTHHPFRFFSFSFSSSSLICCSTAMAPSKITRSSSLLLLQLSAIPVKKHTCVCNGLHLMTSFTQLSRLDCFATTTCGMFSSE